MMYTAYVHEWYLDAVNFNRKHTRKYDSVATTARVRKLLNRPDELAYVEDLEALLKTLGAGDKLEAMQSRYLFDAHSYEDKLLEGTRARGDVGEVDAADRSMEEVSVAAATGISSATDIVFDFE